jgi:predicted amidohydrolase YtcJ
MQEQGDTVRRTIPLLDDHHNHPYTYAALQDSVDLRFVDNKTKALELLRSIQDDINIVLGWNDSAYSFDPEELDDFPPLVLFNASLHGYMMNRPAAMIIRELNPEIAEHLGDREWIENNSSLLFSLISNCKPCTAEKMANFFAYLQTQGIWSVEEMVLRDVGEIELVSRAGLRDRVRFWSDLKLFDSLPEDAKAVIQGIKIFTDGSLGYRTAAMNVPFLSGENGTLLWSDAQLGDLLCRAAFAGKAAAVHAIGDRAIEQVISVVQSMHDNNVSVPDVRIEHAQFISLPFADKARDLGISLCMQPNFSSDSTCYTDRLSPEYCRHNNPFRMLIDEAGFVPGENLVFGSDGMPHGVQYALQMSLFPPYEEQKLTLDEFIAGYCLDTFSPGHIDVAVDYANHMIECPVHIA